MRINCCQQAESLIEAIPIGRDFGKWPNNRLLGQCPKKSAFYEQVTGVKWFLFFSS
jgi:hypothetical protein